MLHHDRVHGVRQVGSSSELAELLTEHAWTLCSGFELEGVLFLNDSLSPDGAQEYAVIRDGREVESITFSWCSQERAKEHIDRLTFGVPPAAAGSPSILHAEPGDTHQCRLCA